MGLSCYRVSCDNQVKFHEHLAKLSGAVTVIKVGGSSGVEVSKNKDHYDDALNAMHAAIKKGILSVSGNLT